MGKAFSRLSGCLRGPAQEIEQFKKVQDPKKRRRFFRNLKREDVNFQEESVLDSSNVQILQDCAKSTRQETKPETIQGNVGRSKSSERLQTEQFDESLPFVDDKTENLPLVKDKSDVQLIVSPTLVSTSDIRVSETATPNADVDEISKVASELVTDIVSEIINSLRELSLATDGAENTPIPVKSTTLSLVKNVNGLCNFLSSETNSTIETQSAPMAHMDEVSKIASKLVSDIISQIINLEKLLSSSEIAQNIPAPVQGTQHSVVKNIDESNDLNAGHMDKVSKVAYELVSDILSQVIESEKALSLAAKIAGSIPVPIPEAIYNIEAQSSPNAHMDEVSRVASKLVSDIISEIINSEKELLLAAEIAGKIPAHVQSTALPVMEDIDELNDFTFLNGGRSLAISNIESKSIPEAYMDEVSKVATKLVSDIIYEIINSEKELLLAAEIAGNVPAPVPATPLPVVKNIDELNDLASSDGASLLNIPDKPSTFQQEFFG